MEYVIIFGFIILSCGLISWSWVKGIDYMKENHPDYEGDDFLNWGNEKIDDEFSKQSLENQGTLGKKPKTQTDYANEHSVQNILTESSEEKIVEDIKMRGLYTESKNKSKKKRNWEEDFELGGSE
jgi:hypothetical protein